jgi:hypothetical protein
MVQEWGLHNNQGKARRGKERTVEMGDNVGGLLQQAPRATEI